MRKIQLLAKDIHIKNREGEIIIHHFSILDLLMDIDNCNKLNRSLDTQINIFISSYHVRDYINEEPAVLYTSLPIYITCDDNLINVSSESFTKL